MSAGEETLVFIPSLHSQGPCPCLHGPQDAICREHTSGHAPWLTQL